MPRSRTPSLEAAKERFEEWRRNRKGKASIPDELWETAVEVARKEGVSRTSTELCASPRRANLPIANGADAARIRSSARTSTTTPRPSAIRGMSRCRHAYRVDWFRRRQRQNSVSCSARALPWS
jgi:hypothetical protein